MTGPTACGWNTSRTTGRSPCGLASSQLMARLLSRPPRQEIQLPEQYRDRSRRTRRLQVGDFDYDGRINADDYFLIDSAFLGQGVPLAPSASPSSQPVQSSVADASPTV